MEIPKVKANHIGKKIERIRELRGMKQDTLAHGLGISQQAVSKMEQSKEIDDEKLLKVAEILGVTVDAIKNFNEDSVLNLIQNNNDNSANNSLIAYQFNPIEKIVELYERLLTSEKQKVELLESLLKNKDKK
ncbi:MAG: helix-turn-helix transcriptional regulator [bacterium]